MKIIFILSNFIIMLLLVRGFSRAILINWFSKRHNSFSKRIKLAIDEYRVATRSLSEQRKLRINADNDAIKIEQELKSFAKKECDVIHKSAKEEADMIIKTSKDKIKHYKIIAKQKGYELFLNDLKNNMRGLAVEKVQKQELARKLTIKAVTKSAEQIKGLK